MKTLPADVSNYPFELPNLSPIVVTGFPISDDLLILLEDEVKHAKIGESGVYSTDGSKVVNQYFRSSSYCEVSRSTRQFFDQRMNKFVQIKSGRPVKLAEELQFLRYDSVNNGKFSAHTDSAYFDAQGNFQYTSPHRIFTTVTYLNSDFIGGDLILNTVVDDLGAPIRIRPARGLTVLFPSDVRFKHEVEPVTQGVRFSIVGWYNFT